MTKMVSIPTPWNLAALRDAVKHVHGADVANTAYRCAQSISKRQVYMQYHYSEVQRLVGADLEDAQPERVLVDYVLPVDQARYAEFHHRRIQAEASLLALLQCIHATSDNLGHVIYYAFNFDADPKRQTKPHKISIFSVSRALPSGPVKDAVDAFVCDSDLIHVAALVNCSKHRSVVSAPLSVSFVKDVESHGLRFEGFHYKDVWYPPMWAMRFVTSAVDALQTHVLEIGARLNRELGA